MALPQIAPLSSEFDMPNKQAKDAVKQEITKLGAVIIEKTSASLKSATQSVIGDVPKMISDLTKEIESGPIDNFAVAINKLVKLVDDLGINLNDYDRNLAKLVDNFRSEQQDAEQKLEKLREQGF
jgi:ABC-type transporter Mla subunit MlaD